MNHIQKLKNSCCVFTKLSTVPESKLPPLLIVYFIPYSLLDLFSLTNYLLELLYPSHPKPTAFWIFPLTVDPGRALTWQSLPIPHVLIHPSRSFLMKQIRLGCGFVFSKIIQPSVLFCDSSRSYNLKQYTYSKSEITIIGVGYVICLNNIN